VTDRLEEIDVSWRQWCSRCGEAKGYDDFYKDGRSLTGLRPECKSCTNRGVNSWREANPERRKAIDRASKDRISIYRKRGWSRKYARVHRAECAARLREYRNDHPDRAKANDLLNYAVRHGKIKPPKVCQSCGSKGKIEGSHTDYSKPLDVEWLCTKCHRRKDNAARML